MSDDDRAFLEPRVAAHGAPRSFGWVRRPDKDHSTRGLAWEAPAGDIHHHHDLKFVRVVDVGPLQEGKACAAELERFVERWRRKRP